MNKEQIFNILYGKEQWSIYRDFKKIEDNIEDSEYLYKYFDDIKEMLENEKSYIRVRGFRIICRLAKYDKQNKINGMKNLLLNQLDDNKPTAIRQCLSALNILLLYKPELSKDINLKLNEINYLKFKDSMSPLIKKDIDNILKNI